jgi:GT2 family glycosyltransferase
MRASIIVLTYNQLEDGTRPCIDSIYKCTDPMDFELILVDNASSDGTPDYLRSVRDKHDNVVLLLNDVNKGFAGGNNDGMRVAQGDSVILLNNDTMVTPNWLDDLLSDLEADRSIGLMGPVTNSAGNEQMIAIPSLNLENYPELSRQYIMRHKGYVFETQKLGFYCVAMRKEIIDKVGYLDEKFGLGMFEDDDFCVRVKKAGYRLMIKEGCFIYHKGSLSFKKIIEKEYQDLFDRNRRYFISKHGTGWLFNDLTMAFYRQMTNEIRRMEAAGRPDPAGIERISVRLNGFKFLIENAMEIERRSGPAANGLRSDDRKMRRALAVFNKEFLHGDRRSRRIFVRKVRRRYRPLTKEQIIDTMGLVRRTEKFNRAIIFPAGPDFGDGKGQKALMAREMAKAGQMVIFGTLNRDKDDVEVISKVQDRLYLMNQDLFPFLPHMATPEETMIYFVGPADMTIVDLLHPSITIMETRDLPSSTSSPDGNSIRPTDSANIVVVHPGKEAAPSSNDLLTNTVLLKEGQEAEAAKDILAILKLIGS